VQATIPFDFQFVEELSQKDYLNQQILFLHYFSQGNENQNPSPLSQQYSLYFEK